MLLISRTFNAAFDKLTDRERMRLRITFSDPLLQEFFRIQVEEAKKQIVDIDPSKFTKSKAEEFLQACQEARSIAQFWQELSDFVKDWATNQGE